MVVSDIGDKLSPKKLPQTIAPNIKAGLQFIIVVNGKNIGTAIEIVPVDVPIEVETKQQIIKTIRGKNLTSIPILINNIKNALDTPVLFSILDNIPANTKIIIQFIKTLFFKCLIHFSPNSPLFLVKTNAKNIEKKPPIQNVFNDALLFITKKLYI